MIVRVVGGAYSAVDGVDDHFQIGKRNVHALRALLQANGVRVTAEDVGGLGISRTFSLHVDTGAVRLRRNGSEVLL
jgi:chemotaxis protein CheD